MSSVRIIIFQEKHVQSLNRNNEMNILLEYIFNQ